MEKRVIQDEDKLFNWLNRSYVVKLIELNPFNWLDATSGSYRERIKTGQIMNHSSNLDP